MTWKRGFRWTSGYIWNKSPDYLLTLLSLCTLHGVDWHLFLFLPQTLLLWAQPTFRRVCPKATQLAMMIRFTSSSVNRERSLISLTTPLCHASLACVRWGTVWRKHNVESGWIRAGYSAYSNNSTTYMYRHNIYTVERNTCHYVCAC